MFLADYELYLDSSLFMEIETVCIYGAPQLKKKELRQIPMYVKYSI